LYTLMTHDKIGRFLSLHISGILKRLCGLAGVLGYLLFPALISSLYSSLLVSCFFSLLNGCFILHVLLALSHLFEDVRYVAACLFPVFILPF
jgi:succinate dehydrogenase/fumarate reductase cytochrome b subunit